MNKIAQLTLSLLVFSSFSLQAQTPSEKKWEADKVLMDAKKELLRIKNANDAFETRVVAQRDELDKIDEELQEKQKSMDEYEKKRGGIFGFFTNETSQEEKASYEKNKRRLQELKKIRDREEIAYKNTHKTLNDLEEQIETKRKAYMNAQNYNIDVSREFTRAYDEVKQEMLKADSLMLHHEIVENKIATVRLELDTIKNRYDTAMLGVYMRDRMLKLLNSKTFCDTAKACAKGENPTVIDSDLNSVFPGLFVSPNGKSRPVTTSGGTGSR